MAVRFNFIDVNCIIMKGFKRSTRLYLYSSTVLYIRGKKDLIQINMFKNTFQSGFLSILYSIGSKPLQIWDKKVSLRDMWSTQRALFTHVCLFLI